jgi:IS1 family transposase
LKKVEKIDKIYTDGNSCYEAVFEKIGISDLHFVTKGKSQTYLIEGINSSIRDNLARFNRKSKRFSRCIKMLEDTLLLFFDYKQYKKYQYKATSARNDG